jgi:hypothetical protein
MQNVAEAQKMKIITKLGVMAGMAVVAMGCGVGYPVGSIYTGTVVPHSVDRAELTGPAKTGDKAGEACATGILSLAAFGDASIDAAKKAGGISEVHSVEFHGTNIVGIYTQGCTVVHGK